MTSNGQQVSRNPSGRMATPLTTPVTVLVPKRRFSDTQGSNALPALLLGWCPAAVCGVLAVSEQSHSNTSSSRNCSRHREPNANAVARLDSRFLQARNARS